MSAPSALALALTLSALAFVVGLLGAPAAQADPVIAAAGDIACRAGDSVTSVKCRQQFTSDLLVNAGPTKVLALGDLQYDDSLVGSGAGYDNTWGRPSLKSITRPVIGNHESRSDYYDYFNGSGVSNGPAGVRNNGWYSYDVGDWHLIALNSNCADSSSQVSCAAGSPQEQWLRSDLAANPDKCTLAYWHHPRFSNGHDGDNLFMNPIWQALYDAEADLVLSGHSHNYERFIPLDPNGNSDPPRGIRQFVVGNGGAFFTGGSGSGDSTSAVFQSDTYGVLMVTLHPASYEWDFVPEAGRTFTDSGTAACHRSSSGGGGPPTTGVGVFSEGGSKTLSYIADPGQANQVTVTLAGSTYTVTDPGFPSIGDMDGAGGCSVSGSTATCPASGVSLVRVDTKDRDDSAVVNASTAASLLGGDGADSLTSDGGKDHLEGSTGNDTLDAGVGDDILIGGAGDDGLAGGAGIDKVDYSSASGAVQVNLSLTTPQATGGAGTDTLSGLENVDGSPAADQLTGNADVNILNGNSGNDTLNGRDSVQDTLSCGSGTDFAIVDTLDSRSSCETYDDGVPPNTTITSAPPAKTDATTATFKFSFSPSSESPATFQCSLDGAAWSICTTPANYSGLGPGPHTFDVRALDKYGNADATPASASWTVTAPPLASFVYSPIAPVVDDKVVFTSTSTALGAGNQILIHEWDLDGNGSFETNSGTSPTISRSYPAPTTITVRLRITDANAKTATATSSLTVSLRPPAPPSPPPGSPLNPSGPFGPIGSDKRAPRLTLGGSKSQRLDRGALVLTAQCDEQCTVSAVAKLGIGRASGLYRSGNAKHVLAAGARTKLRLKFSGKSLRVIRRALAQKRRVFAKLTVQSNDAAGNLSSARLTIRLKT